MTIDITLTFLFVLFLILCIVNAIGYVLYMIQFKDNEDERAYLRAIREEQIRQTRK